MGCDGSFEDSRGWCCAAYTEVAIDYNAGYTGALARLVDYFQDQKPSSDCGLDLGWRHPNASAVSGARCMPLETSSSLELDAMCCECAVRPTHAEWTQNLNRPVAMRQQTAPCADRSRLTGPPGMPS